MGDNGTTAFVVSSQDRSYHILLDAGSGAARALENYLDVLELNAVIISHDHADHVADLGTIQHLLMLKPSGAKHAPVPIYLHDQSVFPPLAGIMPLSWKPSRACLNKVSLPFLMRGAHSSL